MNEKLVTEVIQSQLGLFRYGENLIFEIIHVILFQTFIPDLFRLIPTFWLSKNTNQNQTTKTTDNLIVTTANKFHSNSKQKTLV